MDQTEKLVVLGRMSATLAHEIRNPLAGISAVTQVLDGKIETGDPRKKYVSLIMKEIDRVNRIVHDLLDYTRDSRPYFIKADILPVLDKAIEVNAEHIGSKSIAVEKTMDLDSCPIAMDQDKLCHVFAGVIANAVEAMDDGGALSIGLRNDTSIDRIGPAIELAFKDNGKGSEVEDLSELFSPFYTTKTKGTGLGLAVTQKVIEEHNGRVWAERNEDGGLNFRILLPVDQPEQQNKV